MNEVEKVLAKYNNADIVIVIDSTGYAECIKDSSKEKPKILILDIED